MSGLSITAINFILKLVIIIWLITIGRSIVLMLCGNLYTKASRSAKTAMYPIINIFTMLEIVEISPFLGILIFIPIMNLIVLVLMSIKLGKVYNADTKMKIGLIMLPFIFYPLLARSKVYYKVSNDEYLRALDNAKHESVNLMTQDEIKALNNQEYEEKENVDSIFKRIVEVKEAPEKYKAVKLDAEMLDKVKNLEYYDTTFKPIEKVEQIEYQKENDNPNEEKKFTSELKKDNNVEYIDL